MLVRDGLFRWLLFVWSILADIYLDDNELADVSASISMPSGLTGDSESNYRSLC